MTSGPGSRAALIGAVLLVAACGSTPSAAAPTASTAAGAATAAPTAAVATTATSAPAAASAAPASDGDGSTPVSGATDGPAIIDGNWTKAVGHLEITGGRTLTIDGLGAAFSIGGITSVSFTDEAHTYVLAMTISDEETSGVAISAQNLIAGGTFGKDCQVNLTRNEPAELAGTFSCTNIDAADPAAGQAFKVNFNGTFSAKP